MRLNTVSKVLLIGGGAAAVFALTHRHRSPSPITAPLIPPPDPLDPVQSFDDVAGFQLEPLGFDAEPVGEADEERDVAELEAAGPQDTTFDEETLPRRQDTGDLYGMHTPPAEDRDLTAPEDRDGYAESTEGETWTEALLTASAEGGTLPEREIDPVDDRDLETGRSTDTRDLPIADKGSAGPGGL